MAEILAIDLGSTQMKLMVVDEHADIVTSVSEKYPTISRHDGWLEQDPKDWEKALYEGLIRLKSQNALSGIAAVSFSGHMSGVVLVDACGNVLYPCIMLSDSRSQQQNERLTDEIGQKVKEKTGNPINNAFSLPKLLWLKEKEPERFARAAAWLSPKDYVRFCLTGEIATEYTDAYNSLCVNQETLKWDEEIIQGSTLRREIFPALYRPCDIVGRVTKEAAERYGLPAGIPVAAGGADMACAVLGMGLAEDGDTALTLGTCATFFSVVSGTNEEPYGQVTFHPTALPGKMYALGSHINGGAAVNWISTLLSEQGEIDYEMIAALSEKAEHIPVGSNGLMTIPFLAGSGSPYFCPSDRQHMIGMRMNTSREEVFRSQLEGISYNMRQTLLGFQKMAKVEKLMLAGGGIQIHVWPEIIADVFGIPVEVFDNPDVSTVGAALIGGMAVGLFEHPEQVVCQKRQILKTVVPDKDRQEQYQVLYEKYLKLYDQMHRLDLEEQNE